MKNQKIIMEAFKILRESGIEELNARSLAKELGCSTKPIYFQFKNMEDLKGELKVLAEQKHVEITMATKGTYDNDYISHDMAYVTFARDEKHLFRYLYLNGREDKTKKVIDGAIYEDIIKDIMSRYHIDELLAKNFILIWLYFLMA